MFEGNQEQFNKKENAEEFIEVKALNVITDLTEERSREFEKINGYWPKRSGDKIKMMKGLRFHAEDTLRGLDESDEEGKELWTEVVRQIDESIKHETNIEELQDIIDRRF